MLPFMNRSESMNDEFFSDGLTDELTHAFTRVPGLEVVARTSAFQFKGQMIDVRDIGRRLNVDALIEGSVRRSQNRLRILVQLDDTLKGQTLWSQSYDRPWRIYSRCIWRLRLRLPLSSAPISKAGRLECRVPARAVGLWR